MNDKIDRVLKVGDGSFDQYRINIIKRLAALHNQLNDIIENINFCFAFQVINYLNKYSIYYYNFYVLIYFRRCVLLERFFVLTFLVFFHYIGCLQKLTTLVFLLL